VGSQDLQTARYDQLIRRVGGLYGGGAKVVEALPELFPVLELEDTTPELIALTGWRTAWQNIAQAPSLLELSAVQLSNPVGSGLIAAVTQFIVRLDTVQDVHASVTSNLFTSASIRGLFRDGRFGGNRNTGLELRSDNDIVTNAGFAVFITPAFSLFTVRDDNGLAVLTPGTALQVGTAAVNVDINVTYFWRERPALPSEINFP